MRRITKAMLAVLGTIIMVTGCGSEITYEKVSEANAGKALLEEYDNVKCVMSYETGETEQNNILAKDEDGEPVICNYTLGKTEVYANGTYYYKNTSGSTTSNTYQYGWFMPGYYDEYMDDMIETFLVSVDSEEELVSVEDYEDSSDQDNKYKKMITSQSGAEYDYQYEYILKADTLAITKFTASLIDDGETERLAEGNISYNQKFEMPELVGYLDDFVKMRTVTVTIDPGKDTEETVTVEVPVCSSLKPFLRDGYALYNDDAGKMPFTTEVTNESNEYGDLTLYCISE